MGGEVGKRSDAANESGTRKRAHYVDARGAKKTPQEMHQDDRMGTR